jgi:hypothetical protein
MNDSGKAEAKGASGNAQTGVSPPAISLPKGGGAIRGIGARPNDVLVETRRISPERKSLT